VLTGGIRVDRSTWLLGFPPKIRLRGYIGDAGDVWIDGQLATFDSNEGQYVAPNWDQLGDHQVWCSGKSMSYTITRGDESWKPWNAYQWSFGELAVGEVSQHPVVCGVLTLSGRHEEPTDSKLCRCGLVVPVSNPVLLGAVPGQIYLSPVRSDVRTCTCTAFPTFEPIWALPRDPLHCDKRRSQVLLLGPLREPSTTPIVAKLAEWCDIVLAASRKRLGTEPKSQEVELTWNKYRQIAKNLRRRVR
jgi:hypothetical protein